MEDKRSKEDSLDVTEQSSATDEIGSDLGQQSDTDEHAATVPNLTILDIKSPAPDQTTGFNPYDTGVMHENAAVKKKSSNKT